MAGRRGRWARWAVVGAVAAGAVAAAFDPSGLRRHVELSGEVRRMRAENARLAAENAALAREELRFERPGERVYGLGGDGGAP